MVVFSRAIISPNTDLFMEDAMSSNFLFPFTEEHEMIREADHLVAQAVREIASHHEEGLLEKVEDIKQQIIRGEMTFKEAVKKYSEDDDTNVWHLVGTFKTTNADIRHYYVVPSNKIWYFNAIV